MEQIFKGYALIALGVLLVVLALPTIIKIVIFLVGLAFLAYGTLLLINKWPRR